MTQGYNNLINILNSMPGQQKIGTGSTNQAINTTNKFNPIKGLGGMGGAGLMLLPAWYGKDAYGASGPGRAILKMMYGKPSDEDMDKYKQGYEDTLKWIENTFGGNSKKVAKPTEESTLKTSGKPSDVPDLEILDDASLGAINKVQSDRANQMAQRLGLPQLPPIVTGSNSTGTTPTVSNVTEVVTPEQQANSQAVIDYINKLQEVNQPYIDALTNYYNNYDKYLKNYDRMRRFYTGLAGWTGNQKWADFAEGYNPVKNEAQKVALIKQLQDAKAGDVNAINEAIGNMAVAQELGLPLETAFANKNLLTSLSMRDRDETKKAIALENALVKYYGIDRNNARAIAVQKLRNEGNYNTAMLNAMMFGGMMPYGYQPAPGLNMQGSVPMVQQPMQQPVQSGVDANKALTLEQILSNAQQQNNR